MKKIVFFIYVLIFVYTNPVTNLTCITLYFSYKMQEEGNNTLKHTNHERCKIFTLIFEWSVLPKPVYEII